MRIQIRSFTRPFVLSFALTACFVAVSARAEETGMSRTGPLIAAEPVEAPVPEAQAEPIPTVNLSATEVGPTKPVVVVNPSNMPVPVHGDVNVVNTPDVHVVNPVSVVDAVRRPVHVIRPISLADGDPGGFVDLFTVPQGKQFVLTQASAALGESSNVAFRIDVGTDAAFAAIFDFPGVRSGPLINGGQNSWSATLSMNLYVDAGYIVDCGVLRDSASGGASGRCSISGYLIDAP